MEPRGLGFNKRDVGFRKRECAILGQHFVEIMKYKGVT